MLTLRWKCAPNDVISQKVSRHIPPVASNPIIYYPINFLIASFVAFLSFKIVISNIKSTEELLKYVTRLSELGNSVKREILLFTINYAIVTGMIVAAIISIQFRNVNLDSAILYGFLGAYYIRDKFGAGLKVKVAGEINSEVKGLAAESEKDYQVEFKKIKDKLKTEIKEKLRGSKK